MQYLDFEKPLEELNNKLIQAKELSDIENVARLGALRRGVVS